MTPPSKNGGPDRIRAEHAAPQGNSGTDQKSIENMRKVAEADHLADMQSHRRAWRSAIELAIKNSPHPTEDADDRSYWQHELAAYDRAMAAHDSLLNENARLQGERDRLEEALRAAKVGMNKSVEIGMAEAQGHERTADRLDKEITAIRAQIDAALSQEGGH